MGFKSNGSANGHVHGARDVPLDLTVLGLNSGTSMVKVAVIRGMMSRLLTVAR